MYRFLCCIWKIDDREAELQAAAIAAQLSGEAWRTVMEAPGMTVLCIGADGPTWRTYYLAGNAGVVLGVLFHRGTNGISQAAAVRFDDHESRAISQTGGEHLIRHYWGRYVALLRNPAECREYILRDPTGLLPCYAARIQSVDVYFSWLADASHAGLAARIDLDYVRARLTNRLAYSRRTGLTGISQVLGGECVTHQEGQTSRVLLWNPLQECEPPIEDATHAATELRRVTRDVVQAWARCYPTIVHALSGGLDSSIVLGCLRDVPATITCVNSFTSSIAGDERVLARLAAQKAGCKLVEQHRAAQATLEAVLHAPASPEPIDCIAWFGHVQHDAAAAHEREADAIFSGMGGDELFGRSGAVWAVNDFVRRHGIDRSLFGRALDAACQEQLSVWRVLGTALWGARWSPRSELAAFIHADGTGALYADAEDHPALRDSRLPAACGKRRHAFLLTPVPPGVFDPVTEPVVERVLPLRSQPLLELCLRIPTYILIEGGWDRALARHAFHSDLPDEVVSRRSKGEISEYLVDLLNANLAFVRNLLLEGSLAKRGLVDRAQLGSLLSMARSRDRGLIAQICDCIEVEVWIRAVQRLGQCEDS